jgi:hypothetical protein
MKLQYLTEELEEKQNYKTFQSQNPDIFFSAAFLILNLEHIPQHSAIRGTPSSEEQIQLDYFLPKENKIAVFSHPFSQNTEGHTEQCTEPKIHDDIISVKEGKTTPVKVKVMTKQTTEIKIDIDDLETKCKELIKKNDSSIVPTKIIAILKDDIWNLTCMDNMLGIIRIKLHAISEELLDFNKGGLMDFMGVKRK